MKSLIENRDYEGIRQSLAMNPQLANEGITIPFDNVSKVKAHPLHRICDTVFAKRISEDDAIEMARIFLSHGAHINGSEEKIVEDTPLLAAASLHAEQLGMFYIDSGADIHYAGRQDGATALHWAAYCGRDQLVEKLIQKNAGIDQRDKAHNSTPLGWAVHSLISGDRSNKHHQLSCIKLLLRSGADLHELDEEKIRYLHHLAEGDPELKNLLNG